MLSREQKQHYQELLESLGWKNFKSLVLIDSEEGMKIRKCLKSQVQDKVNASARAGEWEKTAYYTGQLDLIEVILSLPNKELLK